MKFNLPETITIDGKGLLVIWGVLHFAYAFVTHYHSVLQVRRARLEAEKSHRSHYRTNNREVAIAGLWRFFFGLEAKIVECIAYSICRAFMLIATVQNVKPWTLRWHDPASEYLKY